LAETFLLRCRELLQREGIVTSDKGLWHAKHSVLLVVFLALLLNLQKIYFQDAPRLRAYKKQVVPPGDDNEQVPCFALARIHAATREITWAAAAQRWVHSRAGPSRNFAEVGEYISAIKARPIVAVRCDPASTANWQELKPHPSACVSNPAEIRDKEINHRQRRLAHGNGQR
jgi:hypothetical protein